MSNVSLIDGHIDEPNRVDIMRYLHYNKGLTYREVGERFGLTKQRVAQLIGKPDDRYFRTITPKMCIFSGLRKWLNENKVSRGAFVRKLYGGVYNRNSYARIWCFMDGTNDIPKRDIDKILSITGLTYEEAFKVESEVQGE